VTVTPDPIEPPPSRYRMPDPAAAPPHGLVAGGGDLEPGTLLMAYRAGIFPWPDESGRLLWWSPDPRAIMPLDGFHESRRLARTRRQGRYRVTRDAACDAVIDACAREHGPTWITPGMREAYGLLHRLGWVHSVETWQDDALVGGLYGVAIGGLFAAESMFHRARDASKIALAALVDHLGARGYTLLDVQLETSHLASLGAVTIPRRAYLGRLRAALAAPASW
jgi:leucyl/phenylalanyl-tRNA--protein transferase